MPTHASGTTDCSSYPKKLFISESLDILDGCGCLFENNCTVTNWDQGIIRLGATCRYFAPVRYGCIGNKYVTCNCQRDRSGVWTLTYECYSDEETPILLWQGQKESAAPYGIYERVGGCSLLATLSIDEPFELLGETFQLQLGGEPQPIQSQYSLAVSGLARCPSQNGEYRLTRQRDGFYIVEPDAHWRLLKLPSGEWLISCSECTITCTGAYERSVALRWKLDASDTPEGVYSLVSLDGCQEWTQDNFNGLANVSVTVS